MAMENHPWGKKLSMHTSCKGCTERHKACWADCERYAKDKETHEAVKVEMKKQQEKWKPLVEKKYVNRRGRRATGRADKITDYGEGQ